MTKKDKGLCLPLRVLQSWSALSRGAKTLSSAFLAMAGAWGWESRAWALVLAGNLALKRRFQRQCLRPKQEKEMANVDALRAEDPELSDDKRSVGSLCTFIRVF